MNVRWFDIMELLATTLLITVLPMACSSIDDDRSDCVEDAVKVDYELELVTNVSTELKTQLSLEADVELQAALREHLENIFPDHAHDVDLSFYDTKGDSARLEHDMHIMDARQSNYSLNIPKQEYMHLAVANIQDNKTVSLLYDERCHTSRLLQADEDTIDSHSTGLFTAREPIHILEGMNQNFNVKLYMANSASILVVDTLGSGIRGLKAYASGFATSFDICDSLYRFQYTPVIEPDIVPSGSSSTVCYACVTYPSREQEQLPMRSVISASRRQLLSLTCPMITAWDSESSSGTATRRWAARSLQA